MYRLFQEPPLLNKGSIIIPEFIYVRGFYLRQQALLKEYYHSKVRNVDNSHLISKLIYLLNISFKRDMRNYVDQATDKGIMLSSQLRMTSAINHGFSFTPGVFYGESCTEIIIASDEEFDINEASSNWRDLEPIRVLRHPFTDLTLARCDGDYNGSSEKGFAVIEVNVGKLALQYRKWCEEEQVQSETDRRTIQQFVSMYPLTNMISSHLDICFFNRLSAMLHEYDVEPFKRVHPFYIPDYTDKIDSVLRKMIDIHVNKKLTFDHTLDAIPLINSETLRDGMTLPRVPPTRQVKWGLIVARIPLIKFLVKLNNDSDNESNKLYLNRLRIGLREMRNDRVLYQGLSKDMVEEIEYMIGSDIEAYM